MGARPLHIHAAAIAACLAAPLTPAAAKTGTLSGKLIDGGIPAVTSGTAFVTAVRVPDGRIVATVDAARSGAWKLKLAPGYYVLTAHVVRLDKRTVSAIAPVERVRSGKTTRTKVSLKRAKTPPVKKRRGTVHAAESTSPAVAVTRFSASGPYAQLGPGLSAMVTTDLVNAKSGDCTPQVVEWEHRDDVLREIEFSNSKYADPNTAVPRGHLIEPQYFVKGSVSTSNAPDSMSWTLQLVDAKTGAVVGGDSGTAVGVDEIMDASSGLSQRLLDQLCGGKYKVELKLDAIVNVPPYAGAGTVTGELTATGSGKPPTKWEGQAPLTFSGEQYGGIPKCSVAPGADSGTLRVEINAQGDGQISVRWGGEATTSTFLTCPPAPPILNGAPAIQPFVLVEPLTFTMPLAGGTQQIANGTAGAGLGSSGTLTVTRIESGG